MKLLLIFINVLFLKSVFGNCNFPPSLWCSSDEVAIACNVEEACAKWRWQRSQMTSTDADKVAVALYYESMCPDCKEFFVQELYPAFKQISGIFRLELVPYGNAEREKRANGTVITKCQHGKDECFGNIIQTCSLHLYDLQKVMPFLACMELSDDIPAKSSIQCAKQHGIDSRDIMNCATSKLGDDLENKMADKTDLLRPTHTYVPWILLNGVHTEDIQKLAETNLIKLICDTYKGTPPAACINLVLPVRKCRKFNL